MKSLEYSPEKTAARIKALMKYEGIHNKDMAKACGKSLSTWNLWMSEPKMIQIGYLMIIAETLGAKKLSDILEDKNERF